MIFRTTKLYAYFKDVRVCRVIPKGDIMRKDAIELKYNIFVQL